MMYGPDIQQVVALTGIPLEALVVLFILVTVWGLVWKGLALWSAAENKHLVWFIVLLLVNTAGILEIVYLLFFGKPAWVQRLFRRGL